MKILSIFLLFTLCMVRVYSQSKLPLRADTVTVEKTGGVANLQVKDATKDSMGIVYNIGNGVYRNKRLKKLNDSTFVAGNDTISLAGGATVIDTANKWINDIRRSNDSVYAFKNGSWQFKYIDSTGGGSGISGLTAGRITLSTSATTIGDDAGLTYDATINMVSTDSLRLFRKLLFTGDLTSLVTAGNRGAIRFGGVGPDYFREFDDGAGSSGGYLWKVYQKFSCDTCTNNQPFYSTVSTTEYDVAQPANSVFDFVALGDGSFAKPLIRLAIEQNYYNAWELHLPEFKMKNSNARIRPISLAGNWSSGYTTCIYRFDDQTHTNAFGTWQYFRAAPQIVSITPYYSDFNGLGRITLSVNDSILTSPMGGFNLDVQRSAGVDKSTYTHYGEQISHNTSAGFYNLSSGIGAESNVNYGYYITSGNTGRIFDIGKAGQNIAFQVYNNGHVALNRPDQADDGNVFQSYSTGSEGAITARQDNTGAADVTFPLDVNRFSSSIAAGYGMGIRFRSITSNLAGFPYIGNITYRYTDPTQGTEDADFVVTNIRAGSLTEGFRVLSTGAAKFNNAFTFPTADGTSGQVLQTDGSGVVTWQTPSAGTTLYSGDGTLAGDRAVSTGGFTTTWSGANDNETSFSVTNTGTNAASAIAGTANGTTSVGVAGTSSAYIGMYGNSTTATGVQGQSSSGTGVVGVSSTGLGLSGQNNPSSTNTMENVLILRRTSSSGAMANGGGPGIGFEAETATNGNSQSIGQVGFVWSDATAETRTSRFEINGVNNATTARKAALAGDGQWTWDGYGAGTHTVTPATTPVMSSSGVVGERIAPKIYTALLTATAGNAPTATVLGTNEIGSIVWTRVADGNYTGTLSSAFTANKTWALVQRGDMSGNFVNNWISSGSTSTVTLTVSDNVGNPVGDFTNMSIEIRVYP